MSLTRGLSVLLLLAGCAAAHDAGSETPEPEPASETRRALPQLHARLRGPEPLRLGEPQRFVLTLERRPGFSMPVTVTLRLPQGVSLVEPEQRASSLVLGPEVREIAYLLRVAAVPGEDLLVSVDARSAAAGVHYELRHRFGRPAEAVSAPNLSRTVVRVGDRVLGPSVEVTAPQP
jgi:hypothetical protein